MKTIRRACVFLALAALCAGCLSQLTVSSGGASSHGHCNKRECALGSLYGIDWSDKKNGVQSQEPAYPMCRVTTCVRPVDFAIGFLTLGLVIPMQLEYDFETQPLPRKAHK